MGALKNDKLLEKVLGKLVSEQGSEPVDKVKEKNILVSIAKV